MVTTNVTDMYAAKGASPLAGFRQTSFVKRQKNAFDADITTQNHTIDVLRLTPWQSETLVSRQKLRSSMPP